MKNSKDLFEEDYLNITNYVDVEVKCRSHYFFDMFLNPESLDEGIKEIDKTIAIYKELIEKEVDLAELIIILKKSDTFEEARINVQKGLNISEDTTNNLINDSLSVLLARNLEQPEKIERLLLFRKHIVNYSIELKTLK